LGTNLYTFSHHLEGSLCLWFLERVGTGSLGDHQITMHPNWDTSTADIWRKKYPIIAVVDAHTWWWCEDI